MLRAAYFEIPVTDLARAVGFYRAVFGVDLEMTEIDGNEMALFPEVGEGGGANGALAKGETYVPSTDGTLVYLAVEHIDETLARVEGTGGEVLYPKTSIGELGFVAEFRDSEGNRVGLSGSV